MTRDEIAVNRVLPVDAPVPQLLASVEVGRWVAAAWSDIDGRLRSSPGNDHDLDTVLAGLNAMAIAP